MPNVTAEPRLMNDGRSVTYFVDSIGTTSTTYTYPSSQDGIEVRNQGIWNITVTVNGTGYTIAPGQSQLLVASLSSFSIVSSSGTQQFAAGTWKTVVVLGQSTADIAAASRINAMSVDPAGRLILDAITKSQRDESQLDIVCIGDSLLATETFYDELSPKLKNILGDGGIGYVALNNTMTVKEGMSFSNGTGSQQTVVQFSTDTDAIYNPSLYSLLFTGATNSIVSLDDKLHEFDSATAVYLKKPSGGTFNFRDQLLPTNGNIVVDTSAATKAIGFTIRTGWPKNTKSNKLQAVVNGDVQLMGVILRRGTTGVVLHRVAQPSIKLNQVAKLDSASYTAFLQQLNGKIFIVNLGMNDSGDSAATYEANMRILLDRIRAANPRAGIMLLKMNETSDSAKNATLETYRNKIDILAKEYNAVVSDERLALGSYAQAAAAGLMKDSTHPNTVAAPLRANLHFNTLGGSALANIGKALSG